MWPKCKYGYCVNGRIGLGRQIIQPDNKIIWSEGYGPCPACGGTGLAAELTADQAAEYLRLQKVSWDYGYDESKQEWFITGATFDEFYQELGTGPTFTKALSNAAHAVRERRERDGVEM